jgi:hypothetical protein
MNSDLNTRIEALDDKQAIHIVQRLSEALFTRVATPEFGEMVTAIERANLFVGMDAQHNLLPELKSATLPAAEGGAAARALLLAWSSEPSLAPAVDKSIDQFKTAKQDFGILSVPIALGLTYALIAMDLDVDLGFVKIKKAGISGGDQTQIVKKTLSPVLKAIRATTT